MIDRVALFITCLADTLYPEVGKATVTVLERLGVEVVFPPGADVLRADALRTAATPARPPSSHGASSRSSALRRRRDAETICSRVVSVGDPVSKCR